MKLRAQRGLKQVIPAFSLFMLILLLIGHVSGNNNGVGDGSEDCIGCHEDGGNGLIKLELQSTNFTAGQSAIQVLVRVNIDSADSDASMPGVMLLDGDGNDILDSGWMISSDANGQVSDNNYNEKNDVSGDTNFIWTLTAPSTPGEYALSARLIYDDGGAVYLDSETQTVSIAESDNPIDASDDGEDPTGKALSLGIIVGIVALMIIMILRR